MQRAVLNLQWRQRIRREALLFQSLRREAGRIPLEGSAYCRGNLGGVRFRVVVDQLDTGAACLKVQRYGKVSVGNTALRGDNVGNRNRSVAVQRLQKAYYRQ